MVGYVWVRMEGGSPLPDRVRWSVDVYMNDQMKFELLFLPEAESKGVLSEFPMLELAEGQNACLDTECLSKIQMI